MTIALLLIVFCALSLVAGCSAEPSKQEIFFKAHMSSGKRLYKFMLKDMDTPLEKLMIKRYHYVWLPKQTDPEVRLKYMLILSYSYTAGQFEDIITAWSQTGLRLVEEGYETPPTEFLEAYARQVKEVNLKYLPELMEAMDWLTLHLGEEAAEYVAKGKELCAMHIVLSETAHESLGRMLAKASPLPDVADPDPKKYPAFDWERLHGPKILHEKEYSEHSSFPDGMPLPRLDREFLTSTLETVSRLTGRLEEILAEDGQAARERGDEALARRRLLEEHLCRMESLQEKIGLNTRIIAYDLMTRLRESGKPIPAPLYNIDLNLVGEMLITVGPESFTNIAYPQVKRSYRQFWAAPGFAPPKAESTLPEEAMGVIMELLWPLRIENVRTSSTGGEYIEIVRELGDKVEFNWGKNSF